MREKGQKKRKMDADSTSESVETPSKSKIKEGSF